MYNNQDGNNCLNESMYNNVNSKVKKGKNYKFHYNEEMKLNWLEVIRLVLYLYFITVFFNCNCLHINV